MQLIDTQTTLSSLQAEHCSVFGTMTKAVIDISKRIMVVDAELHADQESFLLEQGSRQEDLWGINLYPSNREKFIEYTSLINIRPGQNNTAMVVESEAIRAAIKDIVFSLVDCDA